jgi:signal transduction histidine kinase/ActR/RegA family two-component response regulator
MGRRFPHLTLVEQVDPKYFGLIGAIAIIYFVAGKFGLFFASLNPSSSPVWPPAGIAVSAILLTGFGVWPAIFIGAFFVNFSTSGAIAASLGMASGNTLEALAGAFLIVRYAKGVKAFDRAQDFFKFVAASATASTISASFGVVSLGLSGLATSSELFRIWLVWWLGDMGGFLLVAPFLILWIESLRFPSVRRQIIEEIATLAVIAIVGVFVFGGAIPGVGNYPIGFVVIPILVWSAFRFGQREAATAMMVLSISAIWGIKRGLGPWAHYNNPVGSLIMPQAFMITMAIMTLSMAAVVWERKRAIANANEARQLAEEANRAKDHFLAILGHELRNPLGALSNALYVLDQEPLEPSRAAHLRAIMRRQSVHLGRLVNDLLDVGRLSTGRIALARGPINLAECVNDCIATLRVRDDYSQRNLTSSGEAVWVDGDSVRITQIVNNLLSNALKFSQPDGKVTLTVRAEGDQAVIEVQDKGIGIAPELLPRVFDLFVQGDNETHQPGGGLGIGLTLVRRLVELHGGSVVAVSPGAGHGSIFTIRLPRIEAPRETAVEISATQNGANRTILIVEDNADAREALRLALEQMGHKIFEADSGGSGVETALIEHPDIALIDIGLPEFDGYEVARRIRSHATLKEIILIALTGYGQPEDRQKAKLAGFDAHLAKPVDFAQLAEILVSRNEWQMQ